MIILRRLIFLFFVFVIPNAFALGTVVDYQWRGTGGVNWYSDPVAACNDRWVSGTKTTFVKYNGENAAACFTKDWADRDYSMGTSVGRYARNVCPANSSGGENIPCTCNEGFVENAESTACEPIPEEDPCELLAGLCGGSQGKTLNWSMPGRKAGISWTCRQPDGIPIGVPLLPNCNKGCMGQVGGFTTAFQGEDGNWVTQGTSKMTGAECDPSVVNDLNGQADPDYESDPDPKLADAPDPTCPNGFKGTVNGVSVCLPPKASSGVAEMEEKDNGDGTKTNTKTQVKCENGKCEVTKTSTTTNTATNTTVSSTSTTTTVDKNAYCANNSAAGVCKNEQGEEEGNGKFGGSCDTGFTCEGDAVQCAIAKEQHRRMCQLFDDKAPQLQLYDQEKGKEGVQRGEEGEVIDLPGRISTDSLIGAGTCMADIQVQFMDRPLTVKLSSLCPYLEMLGNILVAVGMVMAIRIVGVR